MAERGAISALDDQHLRIVHCFRSPVGGIFRHVRDLAKAQAQSGHSVGIVCDSTTGGAREEELFAAILPYLDLGLHRLPMQRQITPGDILSMVKAFRHIKALHPDVLHTHGAKGGAYGRVIGTLLRVSGTSVARIYCPHGGSLHYDARTRAGRLFFGIERSMEALTDGLVCVSQYEADTYRAKIGMPKTPWRVVPNGIQDEEFEPVETEAGGADFLYIGMLRDLKGTDVFIDALAAVRDRRGAAPRAEIVGDGPDRGRYLEQVQRLGLAATTRFHAAMPARIAFTLAKTVVIPSRAESLPYIILEAAGAAKPLIATDVGGIPDIFGSEAGRLVKPGDVSALAERMTEALDDPVDATLHAARLRDLVRPRFSVSTMTHDMDDFYVECRRAAA